MIAIALRISSCQWQRYVGPDGTLEVRRAVKDRALDQAVRTLKPIGLVTPPALQVDTGQAVSRTAAPHAAGRRCCSTIYISRSFEGSYHLLLWGVRQVHRMGKKDCAVRKVERFADTTEGVTDPSEHRQGFLTAPIECPSRIGPFRVVE
jgi:hypothetical protein